MTRLMDVLASLSPTAAILMKVSVLLAAGWACHTVLKIRRADARWRVLLWRGLIAGLLLIPLAQCIGGWEVPVKPPAASPPMAPMVVRTEESASLVQSVPTSPPARAAVLMPVDSNGPKTPVLESRRSISIWAGEQKSQLLLAVWLAGAGALFLRSWTLLSRIRRMRRESRPAGLKLQGLLDQVARSMGCNGTILLRFAAGIETPFLTGLRRPIIVLPDRMERAEYADDLPAILAHELAHVHARDLGWMALGRIVSTLLWFHPLAWRLRAAHSEACEEACDAAAAQYIGNPAAYTSALARVALAIVRPVPSAGGIPMARSSQIISRLRLLERGARSGPIRRGRLFFSAAVGVAILTGVACVRLVYAEGPAAAAITPPVPQHRMVNKKVADFPAALDRSSPEGVAVAILRATAKMDAGTIVTLTEKGMPQMTEGVLNAYWTTWKARDPAGFAAYNKALLGAEIVEVITEETGPNVLKWAFVYVHLALPQGSSQLPWATIMCPGVKHFWWYEGNGEPASSLEEALALIDAKPPLERREVNKQVADFPDKPDFSTPEAAVATWERAYAEHDAKTVAAALLWPQFESDLQEKWKKSTPEVLAEARQRHLATKIIELLTDRGRVAYVFMSASNPQWPGCAIRRVRMVLTSEGQWKFWGDDYNETLDAARAKIEVFRDLSWHEALSNLKISELDSHIGPVTEPVKIMVEAGAVNAVKAELVGRIELMLAQGQRDVTARKTITWRDVTTDANGNRSIQYEAYITIWDKDQYITKEIYTFDSKDNLIGFKRVDGYPQKVVPVPVDTGTPEGLKALVEKFFTQNFADITSRETMEWGKREVNENGDVSLRYMYNATLRHGEKMVMNQVFTFNTKGDFVSVTNVAGYPKDVKE